MFERFTERARKTIVFTQEEAYRLRHGYIGTEHLLLGLLRGEDSVAARVLTSLNVTLDEVRERVESIIGYGEEATRQAPFAPRSKKVLEMAMREALQLDHNYIGTEHILLGLVREREGVAARVLTDLGVGPDAVRDLVFSTLGNAPAAGDPNSVETGEEDVSRQRIFRARVGGLQFVLDTETRFSVDLDYEYVVLEHGKGGLETLRHEDVFDLAARSLEATRPNFPERAILELGELILGGFDDIREVTVTLSGMSDQGPRTADVSISRTFRR